MLRKAGDSVTLQVIVATMHQTDRSLIRQKESIIANSLNGRR